MKDIASIHMKSYGIENHDLEIRILDNPIPLSKASPSEQKYIGHIIDKSCDCIATLKSKEGSEIWPVTQAYFSKGKFLFATIIHPLEITNMTDQERYIQNVFDFKKVVENHFAQGEEKIPYATFSKSIRNAKIPCKHKQSVKDLYDCSIKFKY